MRILLSTDFKPFPGGISEYMHQRCLQPPKDGICVIAPSCEGAEKFDKDCGFSVIRYPSTTSIPIIRRLSQFQKIHSSLKLALNEHPHISVVESSLILPGGLISSLSQKNYGYKTAVFIHGSQFLRLVYQKKFYRFVLKNLGKIDLIIANSFFTKELLAKYGFQSTVIHPRFNQKRFFLDSKNQESIKKYKLTQPFFLSCSRLDVHKGIENCIHAFEDIAYKYPDIQYVIGGTGAKYNDLKKLAEKKKLSERIIFIGYVEDQYVASLYQSSLALLAPSRFMPHLGAMEGYGINAIEAMACGAVVIGSNESGHQDFIQHHKNGILVNPESKSDLSSAMAHIIDNPNLAEKMSQLASKTATQLGSPDFSSLNNFY